MSTFSHTTPLELLAPAKNAEFGIEAILHGADAVYIGGPAFGARAQADNSIQEIGRLAAFAHRYHARVFTALNTILRDDELETAHRIIWQLYDAGVDALIIQDMGLLEMDLPPIQLHASTQTDIRTVEKARFLDQVGFSQIVLARELDLPKIRKIAAATTCQLEFFVHGALCVAYSGQCYISHAHTGRSANRGECSQACRLPYDLEDASGQTLAHGKHLLSMKDNDQSANLLALAEAGIHSFKIEGRLKDLSYVKNITAHYRTLLDDIMEHHPTFSRASCGFSTYTFTPRPEKTFNRGATDYFVNGRHANIAAFETPSFSGTPIGTIQAVYTDHFCIDSSTPLNNGDGLSYFDSDQKLAGLRINTAEYRQGFWVCTAQHLPETLQTGVTLYRNHDQSFERLLEKKSAERRIGIYLELHPTTEGLQLQVTDEAGISAHARLNGHWEKANNPEQAAATLKDNLGKLGNTDYYALETTLSLDPLPFLPLSSLKALRREAISQLDQARQAAYQRPERRPAAYPPPAYPETALSYLGNVLNQKAHAFYARHGVSVIDAAYEADEEPGEVSLMITRHCLRYSYNLCPKEVKGVRPDPMTLVNGKERLKLVFDCKKCEMHVVGQAKKNRPLHPIIPIHAV